MKNTNGGITLRKNTRAFFPFWGEGFFVPFINILFCRKDAKAQRNTKEFKKFGNFVS
jgi:hypothetical protein